MLDEPLSALDEPNRLHLRRELLSLLNQLALPSIIVMHDWAEALTLGDMIAVINAGNVLQVGAPKRCSTGQPMRRSRESSASRLLCRDRELTIIMGSC